MQANRRGFLTGGTWCLDRNVTLDFWPGEDMAASVGEVSLSGGGSGCNFAVDMRRLDPAMPVDTTGLIGTDGDGDFLSEVARRHGIGSAGLHRSSAAATQVTEAFYSTASGRRTHILFHGLAAQLTPAHFDLDAVGRRFFHLGLPGMHRRMDAAWQDDANGWLTVLRRARAAGFETSMELVAVPADKLRTLVLPCLPWLSLLVVNDYEIGALSGLATVDDGRTDPGAVREAAARVLERGAMAFVAVHYVDGALLLARGGETLEMPSVRVPADACRGANGAGDAFAAGCLYGYHEGWDYRRCLRLGHAAAAASLRAVGTYDAVVGWQQCLDLADSWGWR